MNPDEVSHEQAALRISRGAVAGRTVRAASGSRSILEVARLEPRWLFAVSNGIVEYATTSSSSNPISAVLGADGNLWVTEYAAGELVAFSSQRHHCQDSRPSPGNPYGIASDSSGDLWVTVDGIGPAVDEFSTAGDVTQAVRPHVRGPSPGHHGRAQRRHLVRGVW